MAMDAETALAELTAILGPDPVGRAKEMIENEERLKHYATDSGTPAMALDEELQLADDAIERAGLERGALSPEEAIDCLAAQCREADERTESLRTALAEKDAAYKELDERLDLLRDANGKLGGTNRELRAENAALRSGEPEAVRYMRMQRDVFCEKLNEKIDQLKAADKENARLRERVAELEAAAFRGSTFNAATRAILGRTPTKHPTNPCRRREWCALEAGHAHKCAEDPVKL